MPSVDEEDLYFLITQKEEKTLRHKALTETGSLHIRSRMRISHTRSRVFL